MDLTIPGFRRERIKEGAKNRCNKAEGKVLVRLTLTISKKAVSPVLK